MKYSLIIMILVVPFIASAGCCSEDAASVGQTPQDESNQTDAIMKDTIRITIGGRVYKATLEANATGKAFKALLPLTIDMRDLNSNEKFFDLSMNLPTNPSNPRTINSGDLMLWGSNTLVLFYETFVTNYSYTRIGKLENPGGLEAALGSGTVTVLIEFQK
jgi:hypothetical protein